MKRYLSSRSVDSFKTMCNLFVNKDKLSVGPKQLTNMNKENQTNRHKIIIRRRQKDEHKEK